MSTSVAHEEGWGAKKAATHNPKSTTVPQLHSDFYVNFMKKTRDTAYTRRDVYTTWASVDCPIYNILMLLYCYTVAYGRVPSKNQIGLSCFLVTNKFKSSRCAGHENVVLVNHQIKYKISTTLKDNGDTLPATLPLLAITRYEQTIFVSFISSTEMLKSLTNRA